MAVVAMYVAFLSMSPVAAATTTTFVLSPATKKVLVNSTFDVDIKITATAAQKINYARAILVFDPTELEITQAVQAGSMFCSYPTDESNYIADNTQGQLMITGSATGAANCAYPEVTSAGTLFAKVTFKAKKSGTADLSFMFNGNLADDMSGITDTNSPPQFIMTAPKDGKFTVVTSFATPTPKPPGNLGVDPRIIMGVAVGIMFVGWVFYPKKSQPRVITTTEV